MENIYNILNGHFISDNNKNEIIILSNSIKISLEGKKLVERYPSGIYHPMSKIFEFDKVSHYIYHNNEKNIITLGLFESQSNIKRNMNKEILFRKIN